MDLIQVEGTGLHALKSLVGYSGDRVRSVGFMTWRGGVGASKSTYYRPGLGSLVPTSSSFIFCRQTWAASKFIANQSSHICCTDTRHWSFMVGRMWMEQAANDNRGMGIR